MLRKSAMYNLKVSTALASGASGPGSSLLAADPQGVTPRTPEILNSLMAMTHPLDPSAGSATPNAAAAVPDLCSPSAASSSSSGIASGSPSRSPPSLQHTRSQLIREGLKLTLQTKRRHTSATSASGASASGGSADEDDELSAGAGGKRRKRDQLTPEDEERRRRRRERNKVAATKCRIKKRERTVNLVQESEILESQNYELKTQIQELETQRRRLVDMLSSHSPTCTRPGHVHQPPPPHPAQTPHQPPPYMYSPSASAAAPAPAYCPSPSTGPSLPAPDLGHQHHHHQHPHHGEHGQAAAAEHGGVAYGDVLMGQYLPQPEDDALPPYYAVTKHEVVDDPLLAALEMYDYGQPLQPYDRPGTLALDTPVSTPGSTPGSLDSPHHAAMGAAPLPGPSGHSHHYQQQHQHLMATPLTPLPLSPDGVGVFGMDSGCMA